MGENPRDLYVAAYGSDPTHGLYRFAHGERGWQGSLLSVVDRLSALAWHPTLPVIYGVSGSEVGRVHAWNVSGSTASTLTDAESGGLEPCHVAVSPDGRRVVVTNYSSSNLMVWDVAADGSLVNAVALHLAGSGRDPERQEAAHPHQAVFESGELRVVNLGTDAVRTFDWTGSAELRLRAAKLGSEFAFPLPELIAATDPADVQRWDIRDRVPMKQWSQGRVTLVGDAAHSTSPYAAYGAGMAIEDGYFLGRRLAGVDLSDQAAVEAALKAYEEPRKPHTKLQSNLAFNLGLVFHHAPAPLRPLRDLVFDHTGMLQKVIGDATPGEIIAQLDEIDHAETAFRGEEASSAP